MKTDENWKLRRGYNKSLSNRTKQDRIEEEEEDENTRKINNI